MKFTSTNSFKHTNFIEIIKSTDEDYLKSLQEDDILPCHHRQLVQIAVKHLADICG